MNAIFLVSCVVLFVVPLVFVLHSVYEDGVIGRGSLLGIAFVAGTFLLEWSFGDEEYEMLPQTVALAACFAVFLCWHLFRFHRRVLRGKKAERPIRVCQ